MEPGNSHDDLWSVEVRSEVVLDLLATAEPLSNNNVSVRRHIFSLPKASLSSWATARKSFEDAVNPDFVSTSVSLRRVVVVGFGYHVASACAQEILVINELQWATYLHIRYDAPRQDQQLGRFHDAVLYVRYADDDDTKAPPLGENVDAAPLSIPSVQRLQQQQQQSAHVTPSANTAADDDSTRAQSVVASAVIPQPALQSAPHVVTDRNKPRDAASSLVSTNTISSPLASVATAPLSETNLALLSSGGGGATLPPPLPSIASTTITVTRTTSSAARHEIGATNALFRESESSGEEEEEEEDDELEDDDDDTATVQHQVASRIAAAAAATRRPPSPTLTEQYGFLDRRPTSPGVVRTAFDAFGTARSINSATSSLLRTTATTVVSDDLVVYTTATGNCYHNERCRYRPVRYMSEADAQRSGLRACMQCGGRPFRRPSQ